MFLIGQRVRLVMDLPGMPVGSMGVVSHVADEGRMIEVDWYDENSNPLLAVGFSLTVTAGLLELAE